MAALFKGRIFAGALFATAIFSHGEQVPVTPEIPSAGGGIYREIPYAKAPSKHVKLHIKTWQEQETYGYIGIKYQPYIAQHIVFVAANTGQEQETTGSIAVKRTFADIYKPQIEQKLSTLVSAYSLSDIATAQVQVSRGTITASKKQQDILSDISVVKDYFTTATIGNANTYQNQHIEGRITLSAPVAQDELVSTHSLTNTSTAQIQEISGKITTQAIPHVAINVISTYQQQAISGRITTSDDDEMLMALLALIELDEGEDYAIS